MKKKLFLGMLVSVALCACGGSDDENGPKVETQVPILFSSKVNVHERSRATDTGFESNDQIGVYITQWNGNTQTALKSSGNYVDNKLYTYSSSGFSANPSVYYPEDGSKIDVYAYYPYSESSSTNLTFAVQANQTTQAGYTKSDLMTSTVTERSSSTSPIPLAFDHALAKIIINLDSETVPTGTKSITLENIYTSCNYNLSSGACSTQGSKSQIQLKADGTNRFIGVLPPQEFNAQQLLATILINGEPYTWTPKSNISFVSNTETEYTLTFDKTGDAVAFTATINPWGEPKINEVVPPDMQDKIKDYMPIYNGSTPPNVMGTYVCSPMYMIASSIEGETHDKIGPFGDDLFRFSNQNSTNNTLDYDSRQGGGQDSGKGYFISGTGNNFTIFSKTTGYSGTGIRTVMATVISGTKTSQGILNYRYAFLMLEKGPDPEHDIVDVGTFRVFKDQDELASNSYWTGTRALDSFTGQSVYSAKK